MTDHDHSADPRVSAQNDIAKLGEWLGFSASCIKSGEAWTPTCEAMRDEARQALANLGALLSTPPQPISDSGADERRAREVARRLWDEACVGREGYCSSDLQDAALTAITAAFTLAEQTARSASLPAGYQWSDSNLEKFEFGRDTAADLIGSLAFATSRAAVPDAGQIFDESDRRAIAEAILQKHIAVFFGEEPDPNFGYSLDPERGGEFDHALKAVMEALAFNPSRAAAADEWWQLPEVNVDVERVAFKAFWASWMPGETWPKNQPNVFDAWLQRASIFAAYRAVQSGRRWMVLSPRPGAVRPWVAANAGKAFLFAESGCNDPEARPEYGNEPLWMFDLSHPSEEGRPPWIAGGDLIPLTAAN